VPSDERKQVEPDPAKPLKHTQDAVSFSESFVAALLPLLRAFSVGELPAQES
jgi:hypothetical protein